MSVIGNPLIIGSTGGGGESVTVTDTTDTAGGTIRTITTTQGTPVIQASKAVTINSNGTTTVTPDTGMTTMGQVVVTTNVSGGGTTEAPDNDVIFIDYDGKIVYSYSAAEFANLSALPANPSHEGLTAQGWNWTLSDAKDYVATYGGQIIGQNYIPTDGKTHLFGYLPKNLGPFYIGLAIDGSVTIDWGNNFTATTVAGSSLSTVIYTQVPYTDYWGNFEIKISVNSGSFAILATSGTGTNMSALFRVSQNAITSTYDSAACQYILNEAWIGANCIIGNYAFSQHRNLASVSLPTQLTFDTACTQSFASCYSLGAIIIPSGKTSILGVAKYSLCKYLSLPKTTTTFDSSYPLALYRATKLFLSPDITSLGAYFAGAGQLVHLKLPPITSLNNSYMFQNCNSLRNIDIPNTITNTTLGSNIFQACYRLTSVNIPSVIKTIGSSAFAGCRSLTEITIPSAVTSISTSAFSECTSLQEMHFERTTPPSVANSNAFTNLPTTCTIYVPYSADHSVLAAYTSASNYPSNLTYTYVEE